ncbi:hypothetical protein [Ferrimonas senticii]|uniref:hypothetical protein n=1 Tax=Ferrimonas senticii TaxID=394566 RepID=UPI00041F596B|nr:hypothetical protein [Ferrimonas senticii]
MKLKQLQFNLLVSISLIAIGLWVSQFAAVGSTLVGVAASLGVISLLNYLPQRRLAKAKLASHSGLGR